MLHRSLYVIAAAVGLIALASCGGSGGPGYSVLSESELEQVRSDPRSVRLAAIGERSDTIIVPSMHFRIQDSQQGGTDVVVNFYCDGDTCRTVTGEKISLTDLANAEIDASVTSADLGARGEFDTIRMVQRADASLFSGLGVTVTEDPKSTTHGLWGKHGYASVAVIEVPYSANVEGITSRGRISMRSAFVSGDSSGSNPEGTGGATWSGVAEAVTRSFERRTGTATVAIPDLSRPNVNVEVLIGGRDIGSTRWSEIPLRDGNYQSGSRGRDFLEGNFHGPDHEETYGAFDTGAYVGSFGAKR